MEHQEMADRLEIYDLYARYAQAADQLDGAAYADCFTADGWTDISSFGHVDLLRSLGIDFVDAEGKIRGRHNLRQALEGYDRPVLYHHLTVNVVVGPVTGDRAQGSAYFVVLSPVTGQVHQFGRYEDVLVRDVDGRWRIAERRDIALYNAGTTITTAADA